MTELIEIMLSHLDEIEIMGNDGVRYTPQRIVDIAKNESRVVQLEMQLNSKLPQDYREFLIHVNGGQPKVGFNAIDEDSIPDIVLWYSLNRNTMYLDGDSRIETMNKWNGDVRPNGLLEIANDSCGNSFCVSLTPQKYGEIYYLDFSKRGRRIECDEDKWGLCKRTDDGFTSLCKRFMQGFKE